MSGRPTPRTRERRVGGARSAIAALASTVVVATLGAQTPEAERTLRFGPGPFPQRIVLTWSADPATSASVTWRTDTSVTAAVAEIAIAADGPRFGRDAARRPATTTRVDASALPTPGPVAHHHAVTFRELRPGTLYAYRVGDGTRWSEWLQFRTASATPEPFAFLYVGDAQNDILSLWSRVIREGFRAAPDVRFIVHAGDLVNNGNADHEWGEWFAAGSFIHGMIASVPAAGNHEYRPRSDSAGAERELSAFWRPQFTLPENGPDGLTESVYWFDHQGARVVVLNSNERQEAQAAWLRDVLRDNPQPWTIAAFHHPIWSAARDRDNERLRALWKPVFDSLGVDLVLQGHDHTYARGRTTTISDVNVASGVNTRDRASGTVYVVSVSGGKMYDPKPGGWDVYGATIERQAQNTQLFQLVRIAGDTLRYEALTATGALYDAFDLVREGDRNRLVERSPATAPRTMSTPPVYRDP